MSNDDTEADSTGSVPITEVEEGSIRSIYANLDYLSSGRLEADIAQLLDNQYLILQGVSQMENDQAALDAEITELTTEVAASNANQAAGVVAFNAAIARLQATIVANVPVPVQASFTTEINALKDAVVSMTTTDTATSTAATAAAAVDPIQVPAPPAPPVNPGAPTVAPTPSDTVQ